MIRVLQGMCWRAYKLLIHLLLITTIWSWCRFYPNFTCENWGTERVSNLPEVIQLKNVRDWRNSRLSLSRAKLLTLFSATTENLLILLIFWHVYISLEHHFAFYCEGFRILRLFFKIVRPSKYFHLMLSSQW